MGIFKKFFNQTRKPEGFWGRLMVNSMNSGHAQVADWGLGHLPALTPAKVLDIGCGGGRNAGELLRRYPEAHVTAVDYSPVSVEKTATYNQKAIEAGRCAVQTANAADLPFEAGAFQLVTAFETVYFWPGLERCFGEVYRALAPGGLFLIVNESDGTDKTAQQFEKIIDGMHSYTAQELSAALETAGFQKVTVHRHEKKPYLAVLAQKEGGQ